MESKPPESESTLQDLTQSVSSSTPVPKATSQLSQGKASGLNFDSLKSQPWQDILDSFLDFLAKIPNYIGSFFSDYRQPLVTLLLIASALVTIYITLAVLDAIDDIPLLSPLLELVGLGYAAWFVYRYLWKAENRKELWQEFDAFKAQIVGKNSSEDV